MIFDFTTDTFFLGLIAVFSGVIIPLAKRCFNKINSMNDRLAILEYIAISEHSDLVQKFKSGLK